MPFPPGYPQELFFKGKRNDPPETLVFSMLCTLSCKKLNKKNIKKTKEKFVRHIALDTETTGLSFREGHRIVEIGCVELENYLPTGNTFHTYLNPKRPMGEGATRVSGITDSMLVGQPEFSRVSGDFLNFLGESILVIHNATFDMGFINGELGLLGILPLSMERTVDTVRMARQKFPGSPANLDALCRRFDIDLSGRTKHGALIDAQLLAQVFLHLSGGLQPHLNLAHNNVIQSFGHNESCEKKTYTQPRLDIVEFLEQSCAQSDIVPKHRTFLEKIENPIWDRYR